MVDITYITNHKIMGLFGLYNLYNFINFITYMVFMGFINQETSRKGAPVPVDR